MNAHSNISLIDRLKASAASWVEISSGSPARLGREVVNDGGFFTRLESQPQGTTTATLEKFARFLIDPANWPEGAVIPAHVTAFAHAVGISTPFVAHATGDLAAMSGAAGAQAERERAA